MQNNAKIIKQTNPAKLCAVVKANAYGLGLCGIASILSPFVDWFAVACEEEALTLRQNCNNEILLLNFPFDNLREICDNNIHFLICNPMQLEIAKNCKNCFLKFDSGMNRLGFKDCKPVDFCGKGIITHLHTADILQEELSRFENFCKSQGCKKFLSAAATSTLGSDCAFDMVRVGLGIFGFFEKTKLVFTLKSRIIDLKDVKSGEYIGYGMGTRLEKDAKIAVISCGYADGLNRKLSNKWSVTINQKRCPLVGNICMDMCMADVTDVQAKMLDEVVIFENDSEEFAEAARICDSIPYELMTNFSQRLQRIYV